MQPTHELEDLFGVAGKTVLVTGGSRGIGLGIASGFSRAGARVYICSRNLGEGETAAAELRAAGADCVALRADLATPQGCRDLAEALSHHEDSLDVLVNNAGAAWTEPLESYPESGWDQVMDLNVKSTFFLTQALLPHLRRAATEDSPARVINVGSLRGTTIPDVPSFAYTASKGAVNHLSRHLANQLAAEHITVNVLAPGVYQTRMRRTADAPTSETAGTAVGVPLGRTGRPADMAGCAIFLASNAGSYLTGTVIAVDGGVGVVSQ